MTERKRQYGRGKFEAHPRYVEYMLMIVADPSFAGMPNATSDGRVNWQVSSGKGTSFHEFYDARVEWWTKQADSLGLPGSGSSNDRFTITARLIHPTGKRPCRLCGQDRDIGYYYLNHNMAARLNRELPNLKFEKLMPISIALEVAQQNPFGLEYIESQFPERAEYFDSGGITVEAFEASRHVRTNNLSPGFMGNPPDRLDGFHDYCVFCRKKNDPGRFDENMRTYNTDRRAFEWWSEGDWKLADQLYNTAGEGQCLICGEEVDRVSPDHVGPLSCGFKQIPLFAPTCRSCNSSKNRRMSAQDVSTLIAYERTSGDSAASWQVRALWDGAKYSVAADAQAVALSSAMRSQQDVHLRTLADLLEDGRTRFLCSLLSPEFAFYDHEFIDLDTSNFTFREVRSIKVKASPLRKSLARRSVRIAFDELRNYSSKPADKRRLQAQIVEQQGPISRRMRRVAAEVLGGVGENPLWRSVADARLSPDERESAIEQLLFEPSPSPLQDAELRAALGREMDNLGMGISKSF